MKNTDKNANRFKGFADIYDSARPSCPEAVAEILQQYLGRNPETVIDIGCGTGLSTMIWKSSASKIVGVEPSDDMRSVAIERSKGIDIIAYIKAFSDDTRLPDAVADIVTCSQSFHWMDPVSTLKEVNRLLKPGGVFAAYDCDWPPVCSASVEKAYENLFSKVHEIERVSDRYKHSFIRYPKDKHLKKIKRSGYFSYSREIVFMNSENCDATRYFNIAVSQGGLQAILKQEPELIQKDLEQFKAVVEETFKDGVKEIGFCYRMRLGVK